MKNMKYDIKVILTGLASLILKSKSTLVSALQRCKSEYETTKSTIMQNANIYCHLQVYGQNGTIEKP